MKQITLASAQKKLESLTIKSESNPFPITKQRKEYRLIYELLIENNAIRPCYQSGSGRYTQQIDLTDSICALLTKIGIEFTLTNDSPRGGKQGNWISKKTKIK
jgi:hypothetical protein